MKTELKRRDFVAKCFKAGVGCCAFAYGTTLSAQEAEKKQKAKPDLKSLTYCGYKCTSECPLYKGTMENNLELKKKAYEEFKFREKFGVEFDPKKIFCYGCRLTDKPLSINVKACSVRKCAVTKGYESCILCDGLTTCDKELWLSFPKFKDTVIEAQKKYRIA
jgi:hypothetical protein